MQGKIVLPLIFLGSLASRVTAFAVSATRTRGLSTITSKPTLYVYDHCPFCVRARMIFGLKKINHQLIFLDNDDVETPTALVGRKVVPILEMIAEDGSRVCMPESIDIVKRVDEDSRFGAPILKQPLSGRSDIKEFFDSIAMLQRRLTRPRFARSAILPEFHTASARAAFVKNHPLKEDPTDYEENFRNSKALIAELGGRLQELDKLIASEESVTEGGLSYDDIDFYGKTRGLTVVKGLNIPPRLGAYLGSFSAKTEIPLYDQMAI